MASPSVTYTFTNGTTADATQVNQNFTDLVNGLSDGTKDLSISALTAAGNTTLNGNTTLGNASSDDLTVTASLASTIPIKTTATYDIGSSTKGLLGLYLGNSTFTTKLATGATASWTFTLPTTAGIAGQGLVNQGSGTVAWKYLCADTSAKSADYTVTDTDMIRTILVTTGASNCTVTLPTAADNSGRILTIKKVDTGVGKVIIDGESSETVNGALTFDILDQYDGVTLQCDGSNWYVLESVARYKKVQIAQEQKVHTADVVATFNNLVATARYRLYWALELDDKATTAQTITLDCRDDGTVMTTLAKFATPSLATNWASAGVFDFSGMAGTLTVNLTSSSTIQKNPNNRSSEYSYCMLVTVPTVSTTAFN